MFVLDIEQEVCVDGGLAGRELVAHYGGASCQDGGQEGEATRAGGQMIRSFCTRCSVWQRRYGTKGHGPRGVLDRIVDLVPVRVEQADKHEGPALLQALQDPEVDALREVRHLHSPGARTVVTSVFHDNCLDTQTTYSADKFFLGKRALFKLLVRFGSETISYINTVPV